jgi:archaemetzincin
MKTRIYGIQKWLVLPFCLCVLLSCRDKPTTILIQPFNDVPEETSLYVFNHLKKLYGNVRLAKPASMPQNSFYSPRQRYKADTIIAWLAKTASDTEVAVGLTGRDISMVKDGKDWGIIGLGYQPGKSCVVSGYRLHKANLNEELFKVVLHELGHTRGIRHCSQKNCFMRAAEGRNVTAQVHVFCASCSKKLEKSGMKLAIDSL